MTPNPDRDAWLRRVRALLDKARSTSYAEEADALVAKAHELMERHAIDEALLATTDERTDPVLVDHLVVAAPYPKARAALLATLAAHTHCRAILLDAVADGIECAIVGHRRDVEHVRAAFSVLELHATRAMLSASRGAPRPRAFRHAFLVAYASRIGQRLDAARTAARSHLDPAASSRLALATVGRDAAVDRAVRERFPRVAPRVTSTSSWAGLQSGRTAADRADLGQPRMGGPRAIGTGR